jgi:hypothetical protein
MANLKKAKAKKEAAKPKQPKLKAQALAKAELNELARIGAELRLRKLEKEVERLRMFLGFQGVVAELEGVDFETP